MKLSEIRGERTLEVVADIIDPIVSIATEKEATEIFNREQCPEGVEPRDFVIGRMRRGLPKLLKAHKGDLIAILAAIEGTPVDEYAESLDLPKLMAELLELFNDEAFLAFLSSDAPTEE